MDGLRHLQTYGLALLGVFAISLSVLFEREQMFRDIQAIYEAAAAVTAIGPTSPPAQVAGEPAPSVPNPAVALARLASLAATSPQTVLDADESALLVAYAPREPAAAASLTEGPCRYRVVRQGVFTLTWREEQASFRLALNRLTPLLSGRDCAPDGTLELRSLSTGNAWRTNGGYHNRLDQIADRWQLTLAGSRDHFDEYNGLIRRYKSQIAQVPILNVSPNFRVASLLLAVVSLLLGLTSIFTLNREEPVLFPQPPHPGALQGRILSFEIVFWRGFLALVLVLPLLTAIAVSALYAHEKDITPTAVVVFATIPLAALLFVLGLARFGLGGALLRRGAPEASEP